MIWARLVMTIIVLVALVYYAMLVLHCFGLIKFTARKVSFWRVITPFYYWIAPYKEKNKQPSKQ